MNKYIDAEKLIAEIERLNSLVSYESKDRHDEGLHDAYKAVKNVIYSLQQEQPEVDLEKEIENEWRKCHPTDEGMGDESALLVIEQFHQIAHYFYELGVAAKKEE